MADVLKEPYGHLVVAAQIPKRMDGIVARPADFRDSPVASEIGHDPRERCALDNTAKRLHVRAWELTPHPFALLLALLDVPILLVLRKDYALFARKRLEVFAVVVIRFNMSGKLVLRRLPPRKKEKLVIHLREL